MLVLARRQHISNAAGPGEGRYERFGDDGWPKSRSWSLVWVMCGRRLISKSFFYVAAALVGCGHVSGLLVRPM
jgi:hypothetical protein